MSPPAPFRRHPLLPGGHTQTLAARLFPLRRPVLAATQHVVGLADGDRLVVHESDPVATLPESDVVAVLHHGLTGDHTSRYVVRIATRLTERGMRVYRLDARGWGAGLGLARLPSNAGRSEDLHAVLAFVAARHPGRSLVTAGFSLGANVLLKLLGERGRPGGALPAALARAVAVCPPVDLAAAADVLRLGANRIYDAHFTRLLLAHVRDRRRAVADLGRELDWPDPPHPPGSVREFDDGYTAPLSGYAGASDYYARCSAGPLLSQIETPTLLLTSDNDPMVPVSSLATTSPSDAVAVEVTRGGGHLGFLTRRPAPGASRRWMDARVVDWLCGESGSA